MKSVKKYIVKKGPADPFRGSWYSDEKDFTKKEDAVEYVAKLTLENHIALPYSWDQYGYEWSVFESEIKIWEGFKFIQHMLRDPKNMADVKDGYLS